MRASLTAAWLVLALAGTAAAQPSMTPPSALPQPAAPPAEELSESTAAYLSLGGTIAAWSLIAVASEMDHGAGSKAENLATIGALGTLLAPSFGHWYARSYLTRGLGLRVAGIAATVVGIGILLPGCEEDCNNTGLGVALLLGGAGLYVGGTIDDIATAPGKVSRYNEDQRFHNVALVPMVRSNSGGLAVAGRF
jgi:hypothetical protein